MQENQLSNKQKVLIVGLGLIGGSYAKALKKQGFTIYAIDKREEAIQFALKNGIIDEGTAINSNDCKYIHTADIIIIGLYPLAMIDWVKEHQQEFKKNVFITDVSGVKCNVIDVVQDFMRVDCEFISSHPMAGRELSGVENSDDSLFKVANFIVTPTKKNSQAAIDFAKSLGKMLGFARIVELSPQEHDEMIGYLSQLTHAIAVSLMNANDNPNLNVYTGDSFRDLTRIAKINDELWSQLFFLNKDILISEIDSFTNELQNLKNCLVENDNAKLVKLFKQSTKRREEFDKR